MLSRLVVLQRSQNFTSRAAILMPPAVLFNHYFGSIRENRQIFVPKSYFIVLDVISKALEFLDLL